jgi:glutathione S-transferase
MSIADLSAACEMYQGMFIELNLSKWPKTQAWLKKMVEEIPEMLEVHQPMIKLAQVSLKKQKAEE